MQTSLKSDQTFFTIFYFYVRGQRQNEFGALFFIAPCVIC